MTELFRYRRPHIGRVVVAGAYVLATSGLLILASTSDGVIVDEWAIIGASIGTLVLLALLLWTGRGVLWLGVGACWIYATAMETMRGPSNEDRAGLALVFVALAFGALGAYTAYRREAPLRI